MAEQMGGCACARLLFPFLKQTEDVVTAAATVVPEVLMTSPLSPPDGYDARRGDGDDVDKMA